ncbi:hypothetical protein GQ600_11992 [Phytophthora cactorum]|nr:hypothetical protein GQ600_11992 [Phytophthora cactorum]
MATNVTVESEKASKRIAAATDRMPSTREKRVRTMEEAKNLMLFTVPLCGLGPDTSNYSVLQCRNARESAQTLMVIEWEQSRTVTARTPTVKKLTRFVQFVAYRTLRLITYTSFWLK